MTQYKNSVCKGSYLLGTACGFCERCMDELDKLQRLEHEPKEHIKELTIMRFVYTLWKVFEQVHEVDFEEVKHEYLYNAHFHAFYKTIKNLFKN